MRRLASGLVLALLCCGAPPPEPAEAARRPHVVMIVLDELPVDSLLDARGRIDGRLFPGFARLARSSIWFPNAYSVYDSTHHAVPAILDGRLPAPQREAHARDHPGSVFDVFGRRRWRVRVMEEASAVCGPPWCPPRPAVDFRDVIGALFGPRDERLRAFVRSIRPSRRATFWFAHSLLPHSPWAHLPSGLRYPATVLDDREKFSGARSFHDRFLAIQARQRHLLQLQFVDGQLARLVRRLKQKRMWERTMVVVTADHGVSFKARVAERRYARLHNLHELAPVPLFIRSPGQRGRRVRGVAARSVDVVPTMADLLGIKLGWTDRDGRSALRRGPRGRRGVTMFRRDFGRVLRLPLATVRERRRASRRRWARVFRDGLYAIGPNRSLLGKQPDSLPRLPPAAADAEIDKRRLFDSVDLEGRIVPAWITGTIGGDGRRRPRELALALNGRIAAVARSFFLKDDGGLERFSAVVAETALRAGANRVELYEVGERRALRLLTDR